MKLLKNNYLMYHTGTALCRNLVCNTNLQVFQVLHFRRIKYLFKRGIERFGSRQNDPTFHVWTTRYLITLFMRLLILVEKI